MSSFRRRWLSGLRGGGCSTFATFPVLAFFVYLASFRLVFYLAGAASGDGGHGHREQNEDEQRTIASLVVLMPTPSTEARLGRSFRHPGSAKRLESAQRAIDGAAPYRRGRGCSRFFSGLVGANTTRCGRNRSARRLRRLHVSIGLKIRAKPRRPKPTMSVTVVRKIAADEGSRPAFSARGGWRLPKGRPCSC